MGYYVFHATRGTLKRVILVVDIMWDGAGSWELGVVCGENWAETAAAPGGHVKLHFCNIRTSTRTHSLPLSHTPTHTPTPTPAASHIHNDARDISA